MTSFEALSIGAPILRALETLKFDTPTEIQAAAIPCLMDGDDLIGVAQTGGGKTAAFVIPMLERLAGYSDKPKPGMPRALILAPTRELALQITENIKSLSVGTAARVCTVYGGTPYKTQIHILRRGVDILVATPGRLRDHMKQGNIYLDETEYFVLDEADRMLDMGFVDEVRFIAKKLPRPHQSVMFSATMGLKIRDLADTLLKNPTHVEVARQATVTANLEHKVMFVPGHKKNDMLLHLIEVEQPIKSLVFVRTRRDADALCDYLEAVGFKADAIHGDKKQKMRQRTINNYKIGKFDFLVATDVAARGIDVKDISHVFNMDVPVEAESYVHRIGRTARGDAHGRAITLCGKSELRLLKDIENLIKMKIDVDHNHPYKLNLNKPAGSGPRAAGPRGKNSGRPSYSTRAERPDGVKANGHKPWEKRAKKRAKAAEGTKVDARFDKPASHKRSEKRPNEQRAESNSNRTVSAAPRKKPEAAGAHKVAGNKAWAQPQADKSAVKKPAKKRVDASAGKRKSKAGAKKRPSVIARKAKIAQTKAFRKATPKSGATTGGNQTLKRRS